MGQKYDFVISLNKYYRKNFVVAKDASSFALRISWLKFEPRVSNFPLIKSDLSDFITASTKFFSLIFITLFFLKRFQIKSFIL